MAGATDAAFRSSVIASAVALAGARDPWWVIGSAAVALHGADPGPIGDIDVLTSARDAAALLAAPGAARDTAAARTRFRSVYGRLPSPALPIEIMGALEVRTRDGWWRVVPETRIAVPVGDHGVFVPDRTELVAILRRFGRRKDLARAALLC